MLPILYAIGYKMSLPKFQSDLQPLQLLQSRWASQLDPLLKNPSLQSILLKDIPLAVGANVINHRLGRTPQGWRVVDIDAAATLYRSAALNSLTLTITSDAVATISLEVF